MHWYSEVIGMPLVCMENGKKMGSIKDIVFDFKTGEVKGLLIENNNFFSSTGIIGLDGVMSIGKDSIIVKGQRSHERNHERSHERSKDDMSKGKDILADKKVCSRKGEEIGIIKDFLFDMETGTIEGFELSDGFVEDLMKGRRLLPLLGKVEYGDESIIVGSEAIDEIVDTGGGVAKKRRKRAQE